jgi:hypothetical protein
MIGADASHAWALRVAAASDGSIWIQLTTCRLSDGHVTLGWGRDYGDVSPLRGLILGGGGHTLKVEVDMEPLD